LYYTVAFQVGRIVRVDAITAAVAGIPSAAIRWVFGCFGRIGMVWGRITAVVVAIGITATTGDALGTCLKVRDNRTTMAFEAK